MRDDLNFTCPNQAHFRFLSTTFSPSTSAATIVQSV